MELQAFKNDINIIYSIVNTMSGDILVFHSICPRLNDGNHGLPDWYFNGKFLNITLFKNGVLDWTPGCGPSQYWEDKLLENDTTDSISIRFSKWFKENW